MNSNDFKPLLAQWRTRRAELSEYYRHNSLLPKPDLEQLDMCIDQLDSMLKFLERVDADIRIEK